MFSPLLNQLISQFQYLPGVGSRSAQRIVLSLLANRQRGLNLARTLENAMVNIKNCRQCRMLSDAEICSICTQPNRDRSVWCVVEQPTDLLAIEQSRSFNGLYFVLMGCISPLNGIGPNDIGIDYLMSNIASHKVNEIILATNPTVEGEATSHYIVTKITKEYPDIKCTQLAYGLSIGSEIEYTDANTIKRAFDGRCLIDLN